MATENGTARRGRMADAWLAPFPVLPVALAVLCVGLLNWAWPVRPDASTVAAVAASLILGFAAQRLLQRAWRDYQ